MSFLVDLKIENIRGQRFDGGSNMLSEVVIMCISLLTSYN
jgi:hypothetical protein